MSITWGYWTLGCTTREVWEAGCTCWGLVVPHCAGVGCVGDTTISWCGWSPCWLTIALRYVSAWLSTFFFLSSGHRGGLVLFWPERVILGSEKTCCLELVLVTSLAIAPEWEAREPNICALLSTYLCDVWVVSLQGVYLPWCQHTLMKSVTEFRYHLVIFFCEFYTLTFFKHSINLFYILSIFTFTHWNCVKLCALQLQKYARPTWINNMAKWRLSLQLLVPFNKAEIGYVWQWSN